MCPRRDTMTFVPGTREIIVSIATLAGGPPATR
jgi:hypothetical protein